MLRGLWNWGDIFPLPRKNAEKAVFQAILWGKQIFKLGDSREKSITYRFRKGLFQGFQIGTLPFSLSGTRWGFFEAGCKITNSYESLIWFEQIFSQFLDVKPIVTAQTTVFKSIIQIEAIHIYNYPILFHNAER